MRRLFLRLVRDLLNSHQPDWFKMWDKYWHLKSNQIWFIHNKFPPNAYSKKKLKLNLAQFIFLFTETNCVHLFFFFKSLQEQTTNLCQQAVQWGHHGASVLPQSLFFPICNAWATLHPARKASAHPASQTLGQTPWFSLHVAVSEPRTQKPWLGWGIQGWNSTWPWHYLFWTMLSDGQHEASMEKIGVISPQPHLQPPLFSVSQQNWL